MTPPNALQVAKTLALAAGHIVMEKRKHPLRQNKKEDHSLVTEADLASDQLIREGLKQFPEHGIVTEEHGLSGNVSSEWIWLIDPLDGTKAYATNRSGFSIMIGLLYQGQPYLGVVYDPLTERLYAAQKNQGSFLTENGKTQKLGVSKISQVKDHKIIISTDFPESYLIKIKGKFNNTVLPPINSVGIKVGLLVRQVGDVYINHHHCHYWDTCAPQMILEEAGGIMTFLDGRPLTYDLRQGTKHQGLTLASNGTQHREWLHLLEPLLF